MKHLKHSMHVPLESDEKVETEAEFKERIEVETESGQNVSQLRTSLGWSVADLSEKSEIDEVTLSQIEKGEYVMDLETAKKLGQAFDVDYRYFI